MGEPSLPTTRGYLSRVACANLCVTVLMAFLTCSFFPCELAIQGLKGHNVRVRVWSCGGILFPLLRHVHGFVSDIKVQDSVEGTRSDPVLSLLAIRRAEELNRGLKGCLVWYQYVFRTGVVRGVPAYQWHGRELAK